MIPLVIFALAIAITLVSALFGVVIALLWVPRYASEFVVMSLLGWATTAGIAQHLFRVRDPYRAVQWYEFAQYVRLGSGAGIAFVVGALFVEGCIISGSLTLVVGFVVIARACIAGPDQGWEAYIGPSAPLKKAQ